MSDSHWDKLLKIKTSGRDDSRSDQYRYPYEPTPYAVLERLAGSGYIGKNNVLLDYGCGKGRVGFFMAYQSRCHCIGVEYDERIFKAAKKNHETAVSGNRVELFCERAENYHIPDSIDRIFFFNPFSVEVLQKVMERIRESWSTAPRKIMFFFYYPSDEYVAWLMTMDELMFVDEIDCRDLYDGDNERERILVFEMGL